MASARLHRDARLAGEAHELGFDCVHRDDGGIGKGGNLGEGRLETRRGLRALHEGVRDLFHALSDARRGQGGGKLGYSILGVFDLVPEFVDRGRAPVR